MMHIDRGKFVAQLEEKEGIAFVDIGEPLFQLFVAISLDTKSDVSSPLFRFIGD